MHEYTSILQILDLVFANTNLGMSICKYTTFVKYWFEGAFQVKYRCPFTVFLNFSEFFLPMKFMAKLFLPMKFIAKHVSTSTNFSQLWLNCSLLFNFDSNIVQCLMNESGCWVLVYFLLIGCWLWRVLSLLYWYVLP